MRKTLLFIAGALLLGFAAGRFSAPDSIRTVDREVVREDTQARERVRVLTEQLETMRRHTRREVVTRTLADGTQEKREVMDTRVDRVKDARSENEAQREVKTEVVREVVREKLVSRDRPDWRVGALLGLNIPQTQVTVGAHVERRIIGPLSIGAWALPQSGAGGVSLSIEF